MKKISLLILVSIFLTSCDNDKLVHKSNPEGEKKNSIKLNLWKAIDIKSWNKTPAINDRVATEDDVKNGLAVYFIENSDAEHKVYKAQLPKLAYLIDSQTKKEELVVVIQIENTSKGTTVGYRKLDGGNGICSIEELKFLDDQSIKQIVGH